MHEIARAGRHLKWLVLLLLLVSPLVYMGVYLWQGPLVLLHLPGTIPLDLEQAGFVDSVMVFLIPALTPLVYWWAFYLLYDLGRQYSQGEVFTSNTVKRLRQIGLLLLATDFVTMLQTAITGPLLTVLGLTEGFMLIELKLGMSVVGLFIVLISRIMVLATQLHEQQRLTI